MFEKSNFVALSMMLSLFGGITPVHATTYTTIAAGSWDSAATWSGGQIPPTNLGGHEVTINHRVVYPDSLADLFIESGTLNVQNVLRLENVNLKMENSSGRVNINLGVIISTDGDLENTQGIVTFTNGAVQLCNGGYEVENSAQSTGNGYIFNKNGNIERLATSTFGSGIAWCAVAGNGVGLSTAENCGVAQPPSENCNSETHYLTLNPEVYDYGDAPASFGEAKHKRPAAPLAYLGTGAPDSDTTSQVSAAADADDSQGTDDENGFTSLTNLGALDTNYSLSVPCIGNGTVAGWIDFDKSGTFTNSAPNERASATCSSNKATLTWDSANNNFPTSLTIGPTFVRLRIASVAEEVADPTGSANDGEVEDYTLNITCTALNGDVAEAAPAIPSPLSSGTKVFVGSRTLPPAAEGHVRAFTVLPDGSTSTTAVWDAADTMDAAERQVGLYSTATNGDEILFNNLDDAAFVSSTTPNAATIKSYTFNPSFSSGIYLAGRENNSFLGPISRGNSLALITRAIDTQRYLNDDAYRSFYDNTVATRSEKVLAASDDGFLYTFNQTDGELAWAWMPRSLVKELKNFSSFQSNGFMRGKIDVLDIKVDSTFGTYVVGAYKNGLGHYVLKISAAALLEIIVWDEDRSSNFISAPNNGEMDYFTDEAGNTFVTYALTNNDGLSTLVIRNIATGTNTEVALNFNVTSSPFVMPDFNDAANAPAKKTLYLGDSNGNIHRTALLDDNGALNTVTVLQTALQNTNYPAELGATEPILFLGVSVSASDQRYYLRAQSESRLTVLQYVTASTNWIKRWTSYVGGAGIWDSSGTTFTADNSGPPTDIDNDGDLEITTNGIQSLPTGATITDAAQVVADSITLPVSVPVSGACFGKAYFTLYQLSDGSFPDNTFTTGSGVALDTNIFLGFGDPTRVVISDMPSKDQMRGFGGTDQLPDNTTGVTPSFNINDSVSTGLRGWKELGEE